MMASKAAFIFLAICFMATIDSGTCGIWCYQNCRPTEPDCDGYKMLVYCNESIHCVSSKALGVTFHACMNEDAIEKCATDDKCKPCNQDRCNNFARPKYP